MIFTILFIITIYLCLGLIGALLSRKMLVDNHEVMVIVLFWPLILVAALLFFAMEFRRE